MQRLACRPYVGHRVSQGLPTIARFNSTKAENAAPEMPPSSATKVPIASSWGDLFIPSREEILRKSHPTGKNKANLYSPNLQYLDQSSNSSLAGRLAKQWKKQEVPTQTPPLTKPPRLEVYHPDAMIVSSPETQSSEPRVDHTIAQRRQERLAREARLAHSPRKQVQQQISAGGERQRPTQQFEGTESVVIGSSIQHNRRTSSNNDRQRRRQGVSNTRRGDSQMRTAQRDSGRKPRNGLVTRARQVKEDEGGESKADISLETLEQGCDNKIRSARTTPDAPPVDLDAIFGRSANASLDLITTHRPFNTTMKQPEDRTQWIKETFGGDYTRFAPHSPTLYLESHRILGPSKHAELVLSKRRDILIAHRHRAQAIIESAAP